MAAFVQFECNGCGSTTTAQQAGKLVCAHCGSEYMVNANRTVSALVIHTGGGASVQGTVTAQTFIGRDAINTNVVTGAGNSVHTQLGAGARNIAAGIGVVQNNVGGRQAAMIVETEHAVMIVSGDHFLMRSKSDGAFYIDGNLQNSINVKKAHGFGTVTETNVLSDKCGVYFADRSEMYLYANGGVRIFDCDESPAYRSK